MFYCEKQPKENQAKMRIGRPVHPSRLTRLKIWPEIETTKGANANIGNKQAREINHNILMFVNVNITEIFINVT